MHPLMPRTTYRSVKFARLDIYRYLTSRLNRLLVSYLKWVGSSSTLKVSSKGRGESLKAQALPGVFWPYL